MVSIQFIVIALLLGFVGGATHPNEDYALRQLLASLAAKLPPGDPCGPPSWQGIICDYHGAITTIAITHTRLNGEIGVDFLNMLHSLRYLNLSHNSLTGSVPSRLPLKLHTMDLSYNPFSGSPWEALSTRNQLSELYLSHINVSGQIPDMLYHLRNLVIMDLSGNSLSGTLPPSLGTLGNLERLYMQDNKLSGSLEVLKNLPRLRTLNVENNKFSGQVPDELLNRNNFSCFGPACTSAADAKIGQRIKNFKIVLLSFLIILLKVGARYIWAAHRIRVRREYPRFRRLIDLADDML